MILVVENYEFVLIICIMGEDCVFIFLVYYCLLEEIVYLFCLFVNV